MGQALFDGLAEGRQDQPPPIHMDYTNFRGERKRYAVLPEKVWFGTSKFHETEGPQWFLTAWDVTRCVRRDFTMKDIHAIEPPGPST